VGTDAPESRSTARPNRVSILGIKISLCTRTELNRYLEETVLLGRKEMILNVNVNCMNLAGRHLWLKDLLNAAPVVFCDGEGVRLAGRWLGARIPEKITYNRWIWDVAALSERHGFTWYMLGASENSLREAIRVLESAYPRLRIVGGHPGYFRDDAEIEEVVEEINAKRPNVLVLGMGMPLQEKWLHGHFDRINVNVALTGGAVFDYISGRIKMTPDLFYRLKLEWLYRLWQQPRRLFRRYLVGIPEFFFRVIRARLSGSSRLRKGVASFRS